MKFDTDRASFVVNHAQMLMLGYLHCMPDWFVRYLEFVDADTEAVRLEHVDLLHRWADGHLEKFEHGREWVDRSLMLMGVAASQ